MSSCRCHSCQREQSEAVALHRYENFRDGLAATVDWYTANEAWWRPQKNATEAKYAQLGR